MSALEAMWQMLQWFLVAVGGVLGMFALLSLIGCFLPRGHVAARSLRSKRPPEEVWNAITAFADVSSWHPEIQKVERLPDCNGRAVWRETDKRGYPMLLETVEATAPRRLVRAIADERGPFSGQWQFDIEAVDGGSQVILTECGQIGNPFFRLMFRLFMTPTFYLDQYLNALAVKLGDDATNP